MIFRALAVIVMLATAAEAKRVCFSGPIRQHVIVGASSRIAGSGGAIVASGIEPLPDWRFRDLNRIVRAHVVRIAPGLAIYHPPPLAGIDVVLEDREHQAQLRTERALTVEEPPAPPLVRSIEATDVSGRRTVAAELGQQVPEHALIVIISRVERDRLVPLSWALVSGGSLDPMVLWHTPYGCDATVETWVEPKAGERVVLSWVDDAGRVSEPSKPIVISGASKGK